MNYEQKYKEALEKARIYREHLIETGDNTNEIEYIFPELKESEDEQHRKWILEYLHDGLQKADERFKNQFTCAINWLEKQGEQKHKFNIGDIISNGKAIFRVDNITKNCIGQDCYFLVNIEDEKKGIRHHILTDSHGNCSYLGEITWLCEQVDKSFEKQSEQNPTDKVEHKFNVGDWITNGEYTWKVIDIKSLDYILQSPIYGDTTDDTISYVDEHFHLWTIEDAKDGDVVAIGDERFLFKKKKENTSPAVYISHCFSNSTGAFRITNGRDCGEFLLIENGVNVCPATNEQRSILFQKISEAGYTWDAEKKELMKMNLNNNERLA